MWYILKIIKPFLLFSPHLFCIILFVTQSVNPYENPYSLSYGNSYNSDYGNNPVKQKDDSTNSVSNNPLQSDNNKANNQALQVPKPLNTDGSRDSQLQTSSIDGTSTSLLNEDNANVDDSMSALPKSYDNNKQKIVQLDRNNSPVGIKSVSPTSSITNDLLPSVENQDNNQAQQVTKQLTTDIPLDKSLQTSSIDGSSKPALNGDNANIDDSLALLPKSDDNSMQKILQLDSNNTPVGIKSVSPTSSITNDPLQSVDNQDSTQAQQVSKQLNTDRSANKPLEISSLGVSGSQDINNPTGAQTTDGNDRVVSPTDPSTNPEESSLNNLPIDNLQNKPQRNGFLNTLTQIPRSFFNRNNQATAQETLIGDQNGIHNKENVEQLASADSFVDIPNSNQNQDITSREESILNSLPNSVLSNKPHQLDNNQDNNQAQQVSKQLTTDIPLDKSLQTSSIDGSSKPALNGDNANIDDSMSALPKSYDNNKQKIVQLDSNNTPVGINSFSSTSSIKKDPLQSVENQDNNQAQQVTKQLTTDIPLDKSLQTSSIDGSSKPALNGDNANIDDSMSALPKSYDNNKQKIVQLDSNNTPVGINSFSPTSSITNDPLQSVENQDNNQAQQVTKQLTTDIPLDKSLQTSSIDGSSKPALNGDNANIDDSLALLPKSDDNSMQKILQLDSNNTPVGIKSVSPTSSITNDPLQSVDNQDSTQAQQVSKQLNTDRSANKPLEISSLGVSGSQDINNPTGAQTTDGNDRVVSPTDPSTNPEESSLNNLPIDNLQNKPQRNGFLNTLTQIPRSLLNQNNQATAQETLIGDQNGIHNKENVEQLASADSIVDVPNSNQNQDITNREESILNSLPNSVLSNKPLNNLPNEAKSASTMPTEPGDPQQLNKPTSTYEENKSPSLRTIQRDKTGGTKLDLQQGNQGNEILENSNNVQVKSTEGLGTGNEMEIIQTSGITTQMDSKGYPISVNNNIEDTRGQSLLEDVNKEGTNQEQNSLSKIPVGLPDLHSTSIEGYTNGPSKNIKSTVVEPVKSKRTRKRARQRKNRKNQLQRNMNIDPNSAGINKEPYNQGILPSIQNNNMQVTYTEDQLRIIDDNKIDQNVKQNEKEPKKKSAKRKRTIKAAKQNRREEKKMQDSQENAISDNNNSIQGTNTEEKLLRTTEAVESVQTLNQNNGGTGQPETKMQDNQGNAISDNNNSIQGTNTEEKLLRTTEAVESVQTLNQNNGGIGQPENSMNKISVGLSDIQPQIVDKQTSNEMGTVGSPINSPEPLFRQNEEYISISSTRNAGTMQNDNTATTEIVDGQIIKNSANQVFKKKNNKGQLKNMRVFCTFLSGVKKMYHKVKKHFVGDLCQAVVFGEPFIINDRKIVLNPDRDGELEDFYKIKGKVFLIVIIKHPSYEAWSQALDNIDIQAQLIMNLVKKYHIDGIQLSNLQPTAHDQLDTDMLCKLVNFLNALYTIAINESRDLKIGITISSYSQSIVSSFKSFRELNHLVNWYSIHTISMLKCSTTHLQGTSPLYGPVSLHETIMELMKTNIRKSKIVVGIQLYPNQLGDLKPSSYYEMCANHQENGVSFDNWCAARPEQYHSKGLYLRNLDIWGVQFYYMESDDYKAQCQCYSFPMIRALLRGMAADNQTKEYCPYLGNANVLPSQCSYDESEFDDPEGPEDLPNQEKLLPSN